MRLPRLAIVPLALLCMLCSAPAHAEPFSIGPNGTVFFNVSFVTTGTFTCLRSVACSGSGTSEVRLGSGDNAARLTFSGVSRSLDVGNTTTLVHLGQITSSAPSGFTFPTLRNPNVALLAFDLHIQPSSPVTSGDHIRDTFGPGGRSTLPMLTGDSFAAFAAGPNPPGSNYTHIVFTLTPFQLNLPANGARSIFAQAGAVPEPSTLVLLGVAAGGALYKRRRNGAPPDRTDRDGAAA